MYGCALARCSAAFASAKAVKRETSVPDANVPKPALKRNLTAAGSLRDGCILYRLSMQLAVKGMIRIGPDDGGAAQALCSPSFSRNINTDARKLDEAQQ